MAFLFSASRYVCQSCMRGTALRRRQLQWRALSSSTDPQLDAGDREDQRDGLQQEDKRANMPRIRKQFAGESAVVQLGNKIMLERERYAKRLEKEPVLEYRPGQRRPRGLRLMKSKRPVDGLEELEKLASSTAAVDKEQARPSITYFRRPTEEFNWYWETEPPDFQDRSVSDHYFQVICSSSPPKLLFSCEEFRRVPESDVPEVAFVGRSNVGKSSLINAIVNADIKKILARTSRTAGFTKTMNFYGMGPGNGVIRKTGTELGKFGSLSGWGGLVLVDMPGYGGGSLSEWGIEIMKYLRSRQQLRRVFVLLDCDHGIKDNDRSLLASLRLAGVPHQVILSKVDKLYLPRARDIKRFDNKGVKKLKQKGTVESLRSEMMKLKDEIQPPVGGGALGEILACSAETLVDGKRFGIDYVRYAILKAVGLERPATWMQYARYQTD